MKNARICITSSIFLLFGCGKEQKYFQEEKQNFLSSHRSSIKNKFSDLMNDLNDKIDDRTDSIGRGYNSITGLVAERCFENDTYNFIYEPSSKIAYEENLTSEQLLGKLGIGVNATIPIQASGVPITLSPEVKYSMESAVNSLSRSSSITIEVIRGHNKLSIKDSSFLKLRNEHYTILRNSKTDFFNSCGDEFIIKQNIKAQLIITAKFIFSDTKTKSEFESVMGASMPVPFNLGGKNTEASTSAYGNELREPVVEAIKKTKIRNRIADPLLNDFNDVSELYSELSNSNNLKNNKINLTIDELKDVLSSADNGSNMKGMSPELKIKVNQMSDELKKNISISIKAIQLGGDPEKLPVLLSANCKLSDPGACDSLFTTIQNYAAKDFPEQLKSSTTDPSDKNNNKKYYLADTEKSLYGNVTITDPSGSNISKEILKLTSQTLEISKFKLQIRKDLRQNFQNYIRAQDIQNSIAYKHLATDEIAAVIETKENSENYLYTLFRFMNSCFLDIAHCQKNYSSNNSLIVNKQNPIFDDIKTWSLVALSQAEWKKPRYFGPFFRSDRISSDFFETFQLRGYSNFMIKYLDMHRNKITPDKFPVLNLSSTLRCTTWFFDSFGKIWFQNLLPNKTYPVTDSMISQCRGKKLFASTRNSDLEKLGVFNYEIWAE
ncbi:hypothetical protein QEJ31_11300 [Pigmentibacter sp. JX0631]|uniref:hypothetical protein n=1 Tax=Pigmentibacter sp. JX0631 TaxID=2976982 RepID=UPI0024693CD4|nr:hypothetical protein [Pigmentibacter sp. JX0631]WGL59106.1 hypothetical protein QEJ31_11300 [Pigmentibacter sp. JX0631]